MWKEGVSRVQYDRPFEVADFVIVPGEVTGETVRDQDHVSYVSPVSLANRSEVLSADLAKQLLGLSREGKYALVQIGSAVLDGGPAVEGVIDCLNSIAPEITPVVLVSPVAKRQAKVSGAVVIHGRYPLAPFCAPSTSRFRPRATIRYMKIWPWDYLPCTFRTLLP